MHWNFQSIKCIDKMQNKMTDEKEGVKKQNSKKGFEENEHVCSVKAIFRVSDSTARWFLKLAVPTQTNQNSCKLLQFRKLQAEISDTSQGLTGMAISCDSDGGSTFRVGL